MKWLLVAVIVAATTCADLFQTAGMKRHGEIHDFRLGPLGRALRRITRNPLVLASVLFMALSFSAFLVLLSLTDLSFAVPATAATYVVETVLARYLLKEHISWKRWTGALLVACGIVLVAL